MATNIAYDYIRRFGMKNETIMISANGKDGISDRLSYEIDTEVQK
jgi:hypothetical protein